MSKSQVFVRYLQRQYQAFRGEKYRFRPLQYAVQGTRLNPLKAFWALTGFQGLLRATNPAGLRRPERKPPGEFSSLEPGIKFVPYKMRGLVSQGPALFMGHHTGQPAAVFPVPQQQVKGERAGIPGQVTGGHPQPNTRS